jgi:hypothetical protein
MHLILNRTWSSQNIEEYLYCSREQWRVNFHSPLWRQKGEHGHEAIVNNFSQTEVRHQFSSGIHMKKSMVSINQVF